jgi:hypothetical protein
MHETTILCGPLEDTKLSFSLIIVGVSQELSVYFKPRKRMRYEGLHNFLFCIVMLKCLNKGKRIDQGIGVV